MVDDGDDDDEDEGGAQADGGMGLLEGDMEMGDEGEDSRVVLHEDKKYYPTAMEVYGEQASVAPEPPANLPPATPCAAAARGQRCS